MSSRPPIDIARDLGSLPLPPEELWVRKKPRRAFGLTQVALAALVVAALLVVGLPLAAQVAGRLKGIDQSSAEATVRSFYSALAAKDADTAASLYRTKNGASLSATQQRTIRDAIARVIASGDISVSAVRISSTQPLDASAQQLLPAGTNALRLNVDVEGTGSRCLPLPVRNGTSPAAQLDGRWYLLEDAQFGFPWTTASCPDTTRTIAPTLVETRDLHITATLVPIEQVTNIPSRGSWNYVADVTFENAKPDGDYAVDIYPYLAGAPACSGPLVVDETEL